MTPQPDQNHEDQTRLPVQQVGPVQRVPASCTNTGEASEVSLTKYPDDQRFLHIYRFIGICDSLLLLETFSKSFFASR